MKLFLTVNLRVIRTAGLVLTVSTNTLVNAHRSSLASFVRHLRWSAYCTRKRRHANSTIVRTAFASSLKD